MISVPAMFIKEVDGEYIEGTGDYGEPVKVSDIKMVTVSGMSANKMNLLFGRLEQGALTIRLFGTYDKPFDYIKVNDKYYNVSFVKYNPKFTVYEVVERV